MVQQLANVIASPLQIANTLSFTGGGEFSITFFVRNDIVLFC
jgi:hypothetical protein